MHTVLKPQRNWPFYESWEVLTMLGMLCECDELTEDDEMELYVLHAMGEIECWVEYDDVEPLWWQPSVDAYLVRLRSEA